MTDRKTEDIDPARHALPVEQLLRHFELDPQRGLDAGAVVRARARHGSIALPEPPPKPLWRTFARQFKGPLIYILFVAAVLAVALGHPGDAGVVLAVVMVNALIGSFQEGRAARFVAALRRLSAMRVRVQRDGGELVVEAPELVPGDTVLLAAGDAVAADARLIEEAQLQVAEAALTGESVPVSKSVAAVPDATSLADRHCMVSSGTHVTAGRARAVVVATGTHTEVGRIAGLGYVPAGDLIEGGGPADVTVTAVRDLCVAAALCNDAQLLPPEGERAGWSVLGDPTEGALLVLACKAGLALETLRRDAQREAELPFDSDTELMATRHRMDSAAHRVWIKGAPEAVLRLCAAEGGAALQAARDAAEGMATQALRVLAFATADDDALDATAGFDALAGRARLLGLVGQIDPPREEVKRSVAECRVAGIRPIMVTGDHKLTGLAVDGPELERMGEADLRDALPPIAVFARVQPAQKLRIVEALQAGGEVVARLRAWLQARSLHPRVVGGCDDSALAKEFGRRGMGVFVGPTVLERDIEKRFGVRALGATPEVVEEFFAISIERRITPPCVTAITEAARNELFALPVRRNATRDTP